MASVALAGPPRVNDKLQTCPTVYKSGTLVELAPQAFFCQTPDASLNHGVGLSRDTSDPATHHFAKRNGSRESFSNTQCLVCFSGSVLEIRVRLVMHDHDHRIKKNHDLYAASEIGEVSRRHRK